MSIDELNDIFISYNHKSKSKIEGLYNKLTNQYKLNVWVDFKKLQIGDNLSLKINQGLKQSKIVIACITKQYSQSKSCQNELVLAQEYQKPLLVVTLEELKIKDIPEISFYISNLNRCNLYKIEKDATTVDDIWASDKFKDEILSTIASILEIDLFSSSRLGNSTNKSNIEKWIESLPLIELKNWSFLISTPNDEQRSIAKRALINSNCPLSILNDLLEKCTETKWPLGLSNIFHRERNSNNFKLYKCRKLDGENVVAIMNSDNFHIKQKDLIDDKVGFIVILRNDAF